MESQDDPLREVSYAPWSGIRAGKKSRREVDELCRMILERAKSARSTQTTGINLGVNQPSAEPPLDEQVITEFIAHRVKAPLYTYSRNAPWQALAFAILSITGIVSGLASAGVAGSDSGHRGQVVIIILGILIGAAGAANQIWRLGQRSALSYRSAHQLRDEGWDYVTNLGRYASVDADSEGAPYKRFLLFMDEVRRINRSAETFDEVASTSSGSDATT